MYVLESQPHHQLSAPEPITTPQIQGNVLNGVGEYDRNAQNEHFKKDYQRHLLEE